MEEKIKDLRPEKFLALKTKDNNKHVRIGILSRKLNEEEIKTYQYPECELYKSCISYRDKNGIPDIFCLNCFQYKLHHKNPKLTVTP